MHSTPPQQHVAPIGQNPTKRANSVSMRIKKLHKSSNETFETLERLILKLKFFRKIKQKWKLLSQIESD